MDYQHEPTNPVHMILAHLTERMNEQSARLAVLEAKVEAAENMSSEEYGAQVVEQIMAAMPAIQAQAMKSARKGGRR